MYVYAGDSAQAPEHPKLEGLGEGNAMVFILVTGERVKGVEELVRNVVGRGEGGAGRENKDKDEEAEGVKWWVWDGELFME